MEALLTDKQAAKFLNLAPFTLRKWRMAGTGPAYVRLGSRTIRYRQEDLEAFVRPSTKRERRQKAA